MSETAQKESIRITRMVITIRSTIKPQSIKDGNESIDVTEEVQDAIHKGFTEGIEEMLSEDDGFEEGILTIVQDEADIKASSFGDLGEIEANIKTFSLSEEEHNIEYWADKLRLTPAETEKPTA